MNIELCDVGVEYDLEQQESGNYEIEEEGYKCPNDAVGKFKHETQHGPPIESWLCEEHAEEYRQDGIMIREVTPDGY